MTKTLLKGLVVTVALLMAGQAANAQIYNEVGDAIGVPPGQSVTTTTTQILGTNTGADPDVYAFNWGGGILTMDAAGTLFDTQLSLFDFGGNGIGENDDSVAFGLQSEISLNLGAGNYLLGITAFNNDAVDAAALPVFGFTNTFNDLNGNFIQGPEGNGPLAGWDGATTSAGGPYQIQFSSPVNAIPEPGSLVLLGLGLAGLLFSRKR